MEVPYDTHDFSILNDGSPTLLRTRSTLTAIDVTMCTSDFAPTLSWKTLALPEVGDHFPILITKLLRFNSDFTESTNINREASQIKRLLRKSANESIPISRRTKIK